MHPKGCDIHGKYGRRPVWKEGWKLLTFRFTKIISGTESNNIIIHLTFLYNQETSEPFANYSSYLQGSHFLVKEATGDENPPLSGSPFKAKFRVAEWEEGPLGLTQQPRPKSRVRPTGPAGRESGEIMNGHEKPQGQGGKEAFQKHHGLGRH